MHENIIIKNCRSCHLDKPLQEFAPRYGSSDSYELYCQICFNERRAERRQKWIDSIRLRARLNKIIYPSRYIIYRVRTRAKKDNILFDITEKDILMPETCPVFGYKLVFDNCLSLYNSPSLDRIDNNIGYIRDNVKIISYKANLIKNSGDYRDHRLIIDYMKNFQNIEITPSSNIQKERKRELLYKAKYRAKKNNIDFNINHSDIIIPEFCPVFNFRLSHHTGKGAHDTSPSLDRLIPELGYTKGNIMVISFKANTIKHCGSIEEHEKICEYIKRSSKV